MEIQDPAKKMIWSIGHSNRTMDEFLNILHQFEIKNLTDVRAFPSSKNFPHFSKSQLSNVLEQNKINYTHLPLLGGKRKPLKDSMNNGWRNPSFRAYADYMDTNMFSEGIKELCTLSQLNRTAYMCAEVLWWQCHRALISDYLKADGYPIEHILSSTKTQEHKYSSPAWVENGKVNYKGLHLV